MDDSVALVETIAPTKTKDQLMEKMNKDSNSKKYTRRNAELK